MALCAECDRVNAPNARFCRFCGKIMQVETSSPPPVAEFDKYGRQSLQLPLAPDAVGHCLTVCPVCSNVNPAYAVNCLRCTVDLACVTSRDDAPPAPSHLAAPVPSVETMDEAVPLQTVCAHCGAKRHAVGATRCMWCKKPLATALPNDENYLFPAIEPENTARRR